MKTTGCSFHRRIGWCLLAIVLVMTLSTPALAACTPPPATGTCDGTGFASRIIPCVREPVVAVACQMLNENYQLFQSVIAASCMLAIIIAGFRMTSGQMRRPHTDLGVMALKVAAVAYFSANIIDWYPSIIAAVDDTVKIVMAPMLKGVMSCSGVDDNDLWGRLDCMLMRFLGVGAIGISGGFFGYVAMQGIAADNAFLQGADLPATMFQMGIGVFVMTFMALMRAIYGFIAAGVMLSFLVSMAPIFLPCMLFRATANYYKKWLGLMLSYLLQPFIIFGFMSLAMNYIDVAIFTGKYSIANTLFTHPVSSFEEWSDKMKEMYSISFIEPETLFSSMSVNAGKQPEMIVRPAEGAELPGLFGFQHIVDSEEFEQRIRDKMGESVVGGQQDFASLAIGGKALQSDMLLELLVQLLGVGILFYILSSLMQTVPELAREVVGSFGHASLGAMPMPGESAMKHLSSREMAEQIIPGFKMQ